LLGESSAHFDSIAQEIVLESDAGEQGLYADILVNAHDLDLDAARRRLSHHGLASRDRPRHSRLSAPRASCWRSTEIQPPRQHRGRDELARTQHAHLWASYGTTSALADHGRDPSIAVIQAAGERPVVLSMLPDDARANEGSR
jgi:hypothetical protein